ncbi:hypothetical protein [Actinacidiphila glaucinigra]|uniref:hypothetical protein n=1 Tax=Actinacidiphila glaucinigra TaxID=235986 RepID=UPI0035D56F6A
MRGDGAEERERGVRGRHPVIALYPAAYRRRHGAEIAATLEDAGAGAGRLEALRETAAVAGHALRMRAGLGSARPAGRAVAGLVPYVVAVAASLAAALLVVWPLDPLPWDGERTYTPLAYAPWPVALGCLLAGRWAWARIAAGAALLGAGVSVPLAHWSGGPAGLSQNLPTVLGLALAAAVVLAAPPDLPPVGTRGRRSAALIALALGVPMVAGSLTVFQALADVGVTEPGRADPMHLFAFFTPLVLAFPAAWGLARLRYGAVCAGTLIAATLVVPLYHDGLLASVPYGSGSLWAEAAVLTGFAALVIRLGLRLRSARERRRTT